MNQNHFVIFDAILKFLSKNAHRSVTFKDLTENALSDSKNAHEYLKSFNNFVFTKRKEREFDSFIVDIFKDNHNSELISNALYYLKGDGLVNYIPMKQHEYITVEITSKGLNKINTGGFRREYKRANSNYWVDRITKLASLTIAFLALCLTYYVYTHPNCK
ncbi:hypothetical protein D0809_21010 [Flavobacterium circumlabens]|uniref:Uncharacterized protein n=1 Tax=Flavobacterium circumlabens TaxID=2133765 RepID=A0A4Y7U7F3_9FLAO|nr:hypothetical protein [Flavobacterium circumlabens]TCN53068.1 hypothetical protein EV142_10951 [Flavobacterium circumlabens]TEB42377.1 hypothetical protein D0809_21010 [Flavobacterium circumlabens]